MKQHPYRVVFPRRHLSAAIPQPLTDADDFGFASGLMKRLKGTPPLTLWSAVLAVGGIPVLIFCLSIGFVPDLDFKAAASMLVAAALLGTAVVFAAAMVIAVPSIALANLLPRDSENRTLVRCLVEAFIGIVASALMFMLMVSSSPEVPPAEARLHLAGHAMLLVLGCWAYWWYFRTSRVAPKSKRNWIDRIDLAMTTVAPILGWFVWSVIVGLISALLVGRDDMGTFYQLFVGFPLLIAVLSVCVVAVNSPQRWLWLTVLGVFGVAMQSALTHQPMWIVESTIERLGYSFGSRIVRVVLSESGCAVVNAAMSVPSSHGGMWYRGEPCVFVASTKQGVMDAKFVSRIGSPYVFDVPEPSLANENAPGAKSVDRSRVWRLPVKSADVLGWSYLVQAEQRKTR